MAKPKLWLGLSAASISLLVLVVAAQKITTDKAGIINDALGLNQTKINSVDSDEVEGSAYADANGSLSDEGWSQMILDAYKFCEETVEQGSVLFKNAVKNGKPVLPLAEDEINVTLFGRGSRNLFMRSGAGGAAPNPSLVVRLDRAFKDAGFNVNEEVFKKYSKLSQSQMTTQVQMLRIPSAFMMMLKAHLIDMVTLLSLHSFVSVQKIRTQVTANLISNKMKKIC